MKTRITLAALALLAVGCSENDNMSVPDVPVNAKAIRVGQSVQGLTRAVVIDGSNVTATVLMCDGETANWSNFVAKSSNDISNSTLNDRANTSTASFKAGAAKEVSFNPALYYDNTDPNPKKSHLVAVAPAGTLAASGTIVTMSAADGQQDVMYAKAAAAGSAASPESTISLSFRHLTTQLNFDVKITEATGTGAWDGKTVSVKEIKVQSTQLPQSVNAADGAVTWNAASSLTVPGISNTVLTASATKTGNPVMIKAGTLMQLDVTLTVGGNDLLFSNVPIKDTSSNALATTEGSSHQISLNVTEPQTVAGVSIINVEATVTPWVAGIPGSGELK